MTQARELLLMDSIAHIGADCAGRVVVTGSHGGASAAVFVLEAQATPHAVFFNDAGVGKEGAGIVALAMLQQRAIAAGAYSHLSARIGDAADGAAHGVITHLNPAATAAGLATGMPMRDALARMGASGAGTP